MIKLGITGGIGSGKTVVSEILTLYGVPVYIADAESKILTDSLPVIRQKLIDVFGKNIYNNDLLDRKLLASYIFSDKEKLQIVNNIIHPEVFRHFGEWCAGYSNKKIVALESAILFESGFNKAVDKSIMVYTPLEMRVKRVMERDNISEEKVLLRINSQMPDEEKAKLSDIVIVNDNKKSLILQVKEVLQQLNINNNG